jgi:hypothetical protein
VHAPVSKKAKRRADPLFVICPITKHAIWTRIATDVRSLTKAWHSDIEVACPHCRETHEYRVSEAFAEAVISNSRIRGDLFASWT